MGRPALFAAMAAAAERRLHLFSAQNLANTAWAFATAQVAAPALMGAVARAAERRLGEFNPQNVANTAWAFATARVEAPSMFRAVAGHLAGAQLRGFTPQNLCSAMWALQQQGGGDDDAGWGSSEGGDAALALFGRARELGVAADHNCFAVAISCAARRGGSGGADAALAMLEESKAAGGVAPPGEPPPYHLYWRALEALKTSGDEARTAALKAEMREAGVKVGRV